jgi:hypothetical protein
MTSEPTASRFRENSLLGISAGIIAVLLVGSLCSFAGFSQSITASVTALALTLPAAIELQIGRRRRDKKLDAARIRSGELRRPVGLVVLLFAGAIVLIDTAIGFILGATHDAARDLVDAGKIDMGTAGTLLGPLLVFVTMLGGISFFLLGSYTSHYLAKRPFLWTAAAMCCALAVRELVVVGFAESGNALRSVMSKLGGSLTSLMLAEVFGYFGVLIICVIGVWSGGRHHKEFLARKLARMDAETLLPVVATVQQTTPVDQTTSKNLPAPDPRDRRLE